MTFRCGLCDFGGVFGGICDGVHCFCFPAELWDVAVLLSDVCELGWVVLYDVQISYYVV